MGCFRSIGKSTKSALLHCIDSWVAKVSQGHTSFTVHASTHCLHCRCTDRAAGHHGAQVLAFLFLARKIAIFEAARHDLECKATSARSSMDRAFDYGSKG